MECTNNTTVSRTSAWAEAKNPEQSNGDFWVAMSRQIGRPASRPLQSLYAKQLNLFSSQVKSSQVTVTVVTVTDYYNNGTLEELQFPGQLRMGLSKSICPSSYHFWVARMWGIQFAHSRDKNDARFRRVVTLQKIKLHNIPKFSTSAI